MQLNIPLNWSFLFIIFALGFLGIWVSYKLLGKNGLYLFTILSSLISVMLFNSSFFSLPISATTALMPLVYFALLFYLNKYGKEEAKKLFYIILISMVSVFVCNFFQAIYTDASLNGQFCLSWNYLGIFIVQIIAFITACAVTLYLTTIIKLPRLKSFLVTGMFVAIASAIDVILSSSLYFIGQLSIGNILLTILIKLVLIALFSLLLGYTEKFFNEPTLKKIDCYEAVDDTEVETSFKNEETTTPEDID